MLETSLLEIATGIGYIFLNPLLYWIILLYLAISYKRIKQERLQFGTKVFPFFSEGKYTFGLCLGASLIISLLAVSIGIVITYEIATILLFVIVILSITASTAFLSASYTIGITFILALLLPLIDGISENVSQMQPTYFYGMALLVSAFLLLEALLLLSKKAPTYPELAKSGRGIWIGKHHVKRLAFVPFFCLFPATHSAIALPLMPYVDVAGESYMLVLFPFVIGYDYKVLTALPQKARKQIGQAVLILGFIVLCVAITSIYYPVFSIATILIAIIGREWILYMHKKRNQYKPSIFHPLNQGVKVLATVAGSPAANLGIKIGETITKVNGKAIGGSDHFYEALQNSGAFFKLEIKNVAGEVRFINSAMYDTDHHELGVIFVGEPYRNNNKIVSRKAR